ncbi:MAG: Hpt domain-containing protein [Nanoarchaeota archaeon]
MDMSEFKEEFVKEVKEHLSKIENDLETLKDGYNKELLVEVKRGFHTLKGNSAAMGYQNFFELSKALNDLTQKIMDDEGLFKEDNLSLLMDGRDKLLYGLDYIINDEPENFDGKEIVEKITKMLDT